MHLTRPLELKLQYIRTLQVRFFVCRKLIGRRLEILSLSCECMSKILYVKITHHTQLLFFITKVGENRKRKLLLDAFLFDLS